MVGGGGQDQYNIGLTIARSENTNGNQPAAHQQERP